MVTAGRDSSRQTVFVGVTSWNSEAFLGHCIDSVKRTTDPASTRIVVLDNNSTDSSRDIAESRGIEVINRTCNQPQALNILFELSRSNYTLLIHSDVILLSERWLDVCTSYFNGNC